MLSNIGYYHNHACYYCLFLLFLCLCDSQRKYWIETFLNYSKKQKTKLRVRRAHAACYFTLTFTQRDTETILNKLWTDEPIAEPTITILSTCTMMMNMKEMRAYRHWLLYSIIQPPLVISFPKTAGIQVHETCVSISAKWLINMIFLFCVYIWVINVMFIHLPEGKDGEERRSETNEGAASEGWINN